ncbi:hypothetical protein C8J57DRAFT_1254240 [Mycena rebaudengoi]|nr:hypothetical protein C8J57DRAFT_1254240 [Mycena rebaudengoi]
MPLAFMNKILVDMEDSTQFCSTYLLNKEFKFAETVTTLTLSHIYLANMDVNIQIIHDNEHTCKLWDKALASRRKDKATPAGQTIKQAAWTTLTKAELHFPYMATPSDRDGTAVEWQEKMHPPKIWAIHPPPTSREQRDTIQIGAIFVNKSLK